jgi:hypothetical protein
MYTLLALRAVKVKNTDRSSAIRQGYHHVYAKAVRGSLFQRSTSNPPAP